MNGWREVIMEEKLIVCLYREEGRGKTHTLKILADILLKDNSSDVEWIHPKFKPQNAGEQPPHTPDICVKMTIGGKRVGLNSDGDDPDTIRKRLEAMTADNDICDIIFCACRAGEQDNWGTLAAFKETVEKLKQQSKNYTVVYTAPYTDGTPPEKETSSQKKLNRIKAEHLADFIKWDN